MKLGVFALLSICIYGHRGCGNEQVPSPEENAKIMEEISKYPPSQGLTETVVPVYFHIIVSENGLGNLSDETIAQQINVINKAFGPAGFRFETAGINRVVNDEWEVLTGAAWKSAAKALRKGGADTLNIYASNLPNSILGIAQFPFQARLMRSTDGVRCRTGTFPGAGYMDYDLGHTCVHEIGHWMVLKSNLGLVPYIPRWLFIWGWCVGYTANSKAIFWLPESRLCSGLQAKSISC